MPRVAILLATYNGEEFLPQQLASFAAQTHKDWEIVASDDGSTDGTIEQLRAFGKTHPVRIVEGPRQGFAQNFLSLLRNAGDADYACFADQDDRWHPDKLARALAAIGKFPKETPVLYGSSSILINGENEVIGRSVVFTKPMGFRNALVQCFAGGNTMVMNRAARELALKAEPKSIVSHDWWMYQLVSGAGGQIIYDPMPTIDYRQHGVNIAGCNRGLRPSLARVRRLLVGQFRQWNDTQGEALAATRHLLTPENQQLLDRFRRARSRGAVSSLVALASLGIYRQNLIGNLGLIAAALLKRM